jgi:hypothetical protein
VFRIERFGATLSSIEPFLVQIVGEGPMTNRSSTSVPVELTTLRRVADGRTKDVKADRLEVLFAMGLAFRDGGASLTIDRQQRLYAALAAQAPR